MRRQLTGLSSRVLVPESRPASTAVTSLAQRGGNSRQAVVDTTRRRFLNGCYSYAPAPPIACGSFGPRAFRLCRRLGAVPGAARRRDFARNGTVTRLADERPAGR